MTVSERPPQEREGSLKDRLHAPGNKRILALDGGGVRGALTLQFLARIEAELRVRAGTGDHFRLSDYFDPIAGTSTGAIIATCLALGQSVAEIADRYRTLARKVFRRPFWRLGILGPKFSAKHLRQELASAFPPRGRLGSVQLQSGLLIMAKRFDTTSPWPLHNNPLGQYHQYQRNMKYICNLDYDLVETVRASTAAPHYFGPERLVVARDVINNESQTVDGWFVDGGVSVMNNPALQAFMVATLDGFRLKWPTGKDKILLVSIGTGRKDPKRMPSRLAFRHAFESLLSLMDDCEAHVETMLQWMSTSPTARVIDGEIGDLSRDLISQNELMTYLRYDVELSTKWLGENLPGHYTEEYVKRMGDMERPRNVPELEKLGEIAAKTLIPGRERFAEHFPPQFDPRR